MSSAGAQTPAITSAIETAYQRTVAHEAESISEPARRARFVQQRLTIAPVGQGFSNLRTRFGPPLFAVFGMAALILLIACGNTVNLLLARAAARQREIAVRLVDRRKSKPAGPATAHGKLPAGGDGGGRGPVFAGWAGDLLVRQALGATGSAPFPVDVNGPSHWLHRRRVHHDGPAVWAGASLSNDPPATGHGVKSLDRAGIRFALEPAEILVASQVAVSLVLLVGAGLFVRTLQNYASVTLGFSQEHILTASINPHAVGYSPERLPQLYRNLVARVESVPGVSSASVAVCALATGCQNTSGIAIDGYQPSPGENVQLQENRVSLNYFTTTGMRLVEGRDFNDRDRENTPRVAIVNRTMVQRFLRTSVLSAGASVMGHPTPRSSVS